MAVIADAAPPDTAIQKILILTSIPNCHAWPLVARVILQDFASAVTSACFSITRIVLTHEQPTEVPLVCARASLARQRCRFERQSHLTVGASIPVSTHTVPIVARTTKTFYSEAVVVEVTGLRWVAALDWMYVVRAGVSALTYTSVWSACTMIAAIRSPMHGVPVQKSSVSSTRQTKYPEGWWHLRSGIPSPIVPLICTG